MSKTTTTTQERLAALAEVAEAAGRLRQVLPPEIDLSDLGDAVTALAVLVVCGGMSATPAHPLAAETKNPDTADLPPHPPASRKPGRKPKTAQVEKAVKTAPASEPSAPRKMMGVCVDCGTSYLKTSNVQKRCPGCGAARKAAAVASVSAGADRLSRIKAIDKRLDTIPGGPADE